MRIKELLLEEIENKLGSHDTWEIRNAEIAYSLFLRGKIESSLKKMDMHHSDLNLDL